jgi:glycosyltransferase involved in cell wall biosynthesis
MNIGIVAPSPVPFCVGGAEKLWWGLLDYINQHTPHKAELIKLPSREHTFWNLVDTYRRFAELDLSYFDVLISGKYPGWMVQHPYHVCYMLHCLRGLYDTYHFTGLPSECAASNPNVKSLVDFMRLHQGDPSRLEEVFDRVDRLRNADVAPEVFIFPGPLIRQVVHFLDAAGLASSRIRRYAAISRNVAARQDYFPAGATVEVLYPPSDLRDFANTGADYFFTVGRLDGAKRIGLLVDAMRRARTQTTLKIVGTGPEAASLRGLAGTDPRIEFLGFVNDRDVVRLYANALAVPYVPYDEDYGLVTVEAMASGKPVLTTTDAGGPKEFVRDGETGYIVEPTPEALAERLDYMSEHRQELLTMKPACQRTVKPITWDKVCRSLFQSKPTMPHGSSPPNRTKPKITLTTTFPIYPPHGGGQSRIYHLYRNLASSFDVEIVSFADYGQPEVTELIADGVREFRIPKSLEHAQAEWRLTGKMNGVAVSDVVTPKLYGLTPRYVEVLKRSAAGSDWLIASHPYLLPALLAVRNRQHLIYEAQDVEVIVKETILPANRLGRYFLKLTQSLEQQCCDLSGLVMTCAEQDGATLHKMYGLDPEKLVVVPNGVDLDSVTYHPLHVRRQLKRQYRKQLVFTVLFMASWHGPNIEAALCLLHIARELPHIHFLLLGSVGHYFQHFGFSLPPNVESLGVVNDETKDEILSWVDLAINPMESGSGTNLKMLDYMAAGIPVLSTPFGARGLDIVDGIQGRLAPLIEFPRVLEEMRNQDENLMATMVEAAREHASVHFSWEVIAHPLIAALHGIGPPRGRSAFTAVGQDDIGEGTVLHNRKSLYLSPTLALRSRE